MWNILGEGPLAQTDEADDQTLLFLFGGDEGDKGPLAWQERALCAQTSCEVREECLEYALAHDERFGIWGGLSERERRKLKRRAV